MEKMRHGRPLELPGRLGEFAEHVGGLDELAKIIGVDERTIRRWAKGERECSEAMRRFINSLAARRRFGIIFAEGE